VLFVKSGEKVTGLIKLLDRICSLISLAPPLSHSPAMAMALAMAMGKREVRFVSV